MDSFQDRTEDGTVVEAAGDIPASPFVGQDGQLAATSAEMGELPVEDWDYQRPKRGEIRTGVILSIEPQQIIVDVDAKRDGIVPYADIQRMGEQAIGELSVGQEVDVYILQPEDQEGNLLVSLFQARQSVAWKQARELADSGEIWEGEVVGYNKGGLVVPLGEIRGFVPASQVPGFPRGLSQEERLQRLSDWVGERLKVKIIEIDRRSRRLILSAAAAHREWRSTQRERLLSELREGEVRKGRVSSLCSFGAFVDLGGADGLVHLSELSWRRVRHPREVVKVGEEVDVIVLRLDEDRKRIGLSLKRLQPEPWALVEDKYELGQLIEGIVTNVVDFGAFAEIEAGVEGLIHVSELTDQTISHPRDVVKKGDLLLLRIIRIDIRRRRLGLSLKRVLESEWAGWAARLAAQKAEEQKAAESEEEAAAEAEASAEAEAEVAVEDAAETTAEVEAEAAVETEAAVTIEIVAETATDVGPEADVEAEAPAEAEAELAVEVAAEAVADSEAEALEAEVEVDEEAPAEAEAELAVEVAAETPAQVAAEAAADSEAEALAEAEVAVDEEAPAVSVEPTAGVMEMPQPTSPGEPDSGPETALLEMQDAEHEEPEPELTGVASEIADDLSPESAPVVDEVELETVGA